jgi:hypothetical protein
MFNRISCLIPCSCRENVTFLGGEAYLKQRGIEVVVLDDTECKELMAKFIEKSPSEWYTLVSVFLELNGLIICRNEDIGEP